MVDSYFTSETFSPDNLFAGHFPRQTKSIILLAGSNYVKGTLLGKITKSTPTTGTPNAGNSGNGTMTTVVAGSKTKLGTYTVICLGQTGSAISMPTTGTAGTNTGGGTCTDVSAGASAKAGTYTLVCNTKVGGAGVFTVIAPTGERLPDATVGVAYVNAQILFTLNDGTPDFEVGDSFTIAATAVNGGLFSVTDPEGNKMPDATTGAAYSNAQMNFIINDGTNDFVAGDSFTIPVVAGSGKYKTALLASVDGSQDLDTAVVLAEDSDATLADKTAIVYETGEFNKNYMTFGTGYTAANTIEALAKRSIFLKDSVAA